jgi:hypothetical protein
MMQKHDEVAKKKVKKKPTLITSLHSSGILKFSLKTFGQEDFVALPGKNSSGQNIHIPRLLYFIYAIPTPLSP